MLSMLLGAYNVKDKTRSQYKICIRLYFVILITYIYDDYKNNMIKYI